MTQSTLRRYSGIMGLATTIVFACTIGYMVTTHYDIGKYEHLVEIERRAVLAAEMVDLLATDEAALRVQDHMRSYSTTSNQLEVHVPRVQNVSMGSDPSFPIRATVMALGLNVSVLELDALERSYSCTALAAGQGLCVLLCFLSLQLALTQLGNVLVQSGRRYVGIAMCWAAHVSGIAFIVGVVVLLGTTQRSCAMFARGEAMRSTVVFVAELSEQMITEDTQAVTASTVQLVLLAASRAYGPHVTLTLQNASYPASLPYYETKLGGSMPEKKDFVAFQEKGKVVVAAYYFSDRINRNIYYIAEEPAEPYILNEEYVSYALTLGLVPYVLVTLVGIVLLPYPSLGALESGAAGVFPQAWRMSRRFGDVKWLHLVLIVVVVVSMCTVALTTSYGNRYVFDRLAVSLDSFIGASTTATEVAAVLLDTLVSIVERQFYESSDVHFPDGTATAAEEASLKDWYIEVVSRVATMRYNMSSIVDALRTSGTVPSLYLAANFQTLIASVSVDRAQVLRTRGLTVDFRFRSFSRTSDYDALKTRLGTNYALLRQAANASETELALFDVCWAAYLNEIDPYVQIATKFRAQVYAPKDIRELYLTTTGVAASALEDDIIDRVLTSSEKPPYAAIVSSQYAEFIVYAALATVLPAIILLTLAAMWDAWYTHHLFALNHRWVPANDPTAVHTKLYVDHARLWANLRTILGLSSLVCLVLVVLSSVMYMQATADADLRYMEEESESIVVVEKKRLLTAQSRFMSTSFRWTRGSLSRSNDDLVRAVSGVLSWAHYLQNLVANWPGPTDSTVRSALIEASHELEVVTRQAILVCGIRLIALVYAFEQLTELMEGVYVNSNVTAASATECFGPEGAQDLFGTMSAFFDVLVFNQGQDAITPLEARFTYYSTLNASCNLNDELSNMSMYSHIAYGLHTRDDRISLPAIGGYLRGNATSAQDKLAPLLDFKAQELPFSAYYAVFWVPVLLGWLTLPLLHIVRRRAVNSVQALL